MCPGRVISVESPAVLPVLSPWRCRAQSWSPGGFHLLLHGSFHHTDDETSFTWLATFRNKSTLSGVLVHDYVELLQPFDPTNRGVHYLAARSRMIGKRWGLTTSASPRPFYL